MRIGLLYPPSTFLTDPMVWPPLGLWYLAAQLEAQGHTTDFRDLSLDNRLPHDGDYDQLWISATSPQMFEVRRLSEHVKGWTKTRTVFGGPAPWAKPQIASELAFDLVVSGEADHPDTVARIVEQANNPSQQLFVAPVQHDLAWTLPPIRRWNLDYHSYMHDRHGRRYRMASIFTVRGCPMECIEGSQRVLMADWSWRPIREVAPGDEVMAYQAGKRGTVAPTKVTHRIPKGKRPLVRLDAGGRSVLCTPDHKIYADDGHKTRWKRADTARSGKMSVRMLAPVDRSAEFRRGWCAGYIAGDGSIHRRIRQVNITVTSRDSELLNTLQAWSREFGCEFRPFRHNYGSEGSFPSPMPGTHIAGMQCTSGKQAVPFLWRIAGGEKSSRDYMLGWLGGIYDADGGLSGGQCRIYQSHTANPVKVGQIETCLRSCGLPYNKQVRPSGQTIFVISAASFLTSCRPTLKRKHRTSFAYKSLPKSPLTIESVAGEHDVFDLTTEAGTFVCEGFIVHNCAFCESGRHGVIWGRSVRYEPLNKVEQQIADVVAMGFEGLAYYDDIFILNRKRALGLMDLHHKYGLVFRCFLRSDVLVKHGGREYLKQLADAGLVEIFVGVESADNRVKANIHKGTTIEQDQAVLGWCKELGVVCKMSFILGLPGESRESMEMTRSWILKHRPDRVGLDRLILFPGTPLTAHIEQYDIKVERPVPEEFFFRGRQDLAHGSFVSTSSLTSKDIDDFRRRCEREFAEAGIRP